MKTSLVSICRNSAESIQRCIDSVLGQKLKPQEYIFVEGQSTDQTMKLLEENLPRLEAAGIKASILQQKRVPGEAGIPAAWNQALALAQGDIVALLNSDDWYEPDCLQKVHESFADNPDIEALVCPIRLHLPQGGQKLLAPRCLCLLPLLMPWPHPGSFFKASLYRRLGQYDTRYSIAADYDFVWRCHRAGVPWLALGDILVNMEGGGMANRNRGPARQETLAIARRHAPKSPLPYLAYALRKLSGR
jgi:glycosyltransferase involved in cell wall biosynthesis